MTDAENQERNKQRVIDELTARLSCPNPIRVGDKVRVVSGSLRLSGWTGTVRSIYLYEGLVTQWKATVRFNGHGARDLSVNSLERITERITV